MVIVVVMTTFAILEERGTQLPISFSFALHKLALDSIWKYDWKRWEIQLVTKLVSASDGAVCSAAFGAVCKLVQ